jgi:hypothetical protein
MESQLWTPYSTVINGAAMNIIVVELPDNMNAQLGAKQPPATRWRALCGTPRQKRERSDDRGGGRRRTDMRRSLLIMVVLLFVAGCTSDNAGPPPATPQAEQPASPPMPPPAPAPTVNAGPDQTVKLGTTVALSGSSTTTEQNPQYSWSFVSLPQGSGAMLKDPTTLTPTFAPDLVGLYVLRLTLDGSAAADEVTVDVQANLLTLHFTGTFGPDGTVDGSFTYEITQGPNDTNVRNLKPNVLYRLTSWNIVVNSGQIADLLPSTVFDSSQPDNTVEFCEGICIFSSTPIVDLRFHNIGPDMLQLMFQHADPTPFINPPATLAEWGPHFESYYRVPNDVPLAILHTGVLTEAP